jgi:Cellulose biosynthesis protein BcsS
MWRSAAMHFLLLASSLAGFSRAEADQASDLLYFSGELISGRGYAGAGLLHAFSGLDSSGFIIAADGGASQSNQTLADVQAGWRTISGKFYLTVTGGFEADPRFHPLGSADLWWELSPKWMAQARFEAASDWTAWRMAAGWRPNDHWPWIGPEAAASASWPRVGLHATGVKLPFSVEASVSAGVSWREGRQFGPYVTLSLWRRF